ncbi:MAG TPA: helix-hairpin-helix domain-containing protein, partial [Terriglobales bacterium]|nr:helix-hairpin-helix domain-containing protein [Terriglobales bacterium]
RRITALVAIALAGLVATAPAEQKPLDINTATVEQLNALQGIGDSKARAIVSYRDEHGPFRSVDDLKEVKGIGDKLLESIRSQVTVASSPAPGGAAKAVR